MQRLGRRVEATAPVPIESGSDELRSFFEGAAMPLHRVANDGTIVWANPAELKLLGYAPDEYIGHNIREFHVDEAVIEDILRRLAAGEELIDYEARLRAKDGSIRYVSITTNVYWRNGEFVHTRCFTRDITEQKRATELQERLAAIVESSDDAIISKDLNGTIQSWNSGAQRIFGYTAEEAIGQPVTMLAPPDRFEDFGKIIERIRRGERVEHYETKRKTKDGRILDVSLTVSPIRDASGTIVGASKIARDITGQRRATELQERMAAIVESSDDAIISKDLNGIIQSWNSGAQRIFGYTAEEAIGKPVTILAVPERVEEIPNILQRIRRGERVEHYETKRRTKDGRILDVSLTVSPIRNASGTIIGASKIARDITEKKRHEEERAALLVRERETRETFELLNEIGPRLLAELDLERVKQVVVDTSTRLAGGEVGILTTPDGAAVTAGALSALPSVQRLALRLLEENTGPLRVDDASEPGLRSFLGVSVISRSGEVLAALCFGHSVAGRFTDWHERVVSGIAAQAAIALDNARLFSEVSTAREAAEQTNEELRRANADLEQFAFSASHDLKEPLRMIALYSQILQRKYRDKLDDEARGHFDYVIEGARRMDRLVQDLLAYTQSAVVLERGHSSEAVDADAVLSQAVSNLAPVITETNATIEHGQLPALCMGEVHLLQLFQNLIENAIKYRSEEPPRIRVQAARDGGCWRISVQDNGIGIAPEYREHVFGIFKRLHTSDKYSGTGIGLAICQRIVNRYGGKIWVEGGPGGKGSTFCFTLRGADASAVSGRSSEADR